MAIKGFNEIVYDLINSIHDALPEADTKDGTFLRDVFINPQATQLSNLYNTIYLASQAQSVLTATGEELDRLASNYFLKRKRATKAQGYVIFKVSKNLINPISIPSGTIISTTPTPNQAAINFVTVTSMIVSTNTIADTDTTGLYFLIKMPIIAQNEGASGNVGANEIKRFQTVLDNAVVGCYNEFATTGGSDQETDYNLAIRINLALAGSSIGTKDGYLSFILNQPGVADAKVVSAGETLMVRDNGEGGCVDIYVRALNNQQNKATFTMPSNYNVGDVSDGQNPLLSYWNIPLTKNAVTSNMQSYFGSTTLPNAPVSYILSVIGTDPNNAENTITYLNGSDYSIEPTTNKFYVDNAWSFVDPTGNSTSENATKLLNASLSNYQTTNGITAIEPFLPSTNWSAITWDTTSDNNFDLGNISGLSYPAVGNNPPKDKVFILRSKTISNNSMTSERFFVYQDGQWFERLYKQPDFVLLRDLTPETGGSVKCKEYLHWMANDFTIDRGYIPKKPSNGEVITITYMTNGAISSLQEKVDNAKILTADVLVMQTQRIGVTIYAKIKKSSNITEEQVKTNIYNAIIEQIENKQQLGGSVTKSNLAKIITTTDGVDLLELKTLTLKYADGSIADVEISASSRQYLGVDRITIQFADQVLG